MSRRLTQPALLVVALGAVLSGVLTVAPRALATAEPDACGASAPTRSAAWRAYVPAATPVRPRRASPATRARSGGPAGWRLVLATSHGADGSCLLKIRLSRRPNAAAAWVAAHRVSLLRTPWRIEILRSARRAVLRRSGRAVARWPVVVGAPATPTPAGTFAIEASFRSPPASFSGSWILTLTAHSDALRTFEGGNGRVALHGRGAASLADPLGTAASHGCIRFGNRAISSIVRRIGRDALPGTPVAVV